MTEPDDAGHDDDTLRETELVGELTEPPYEEVDVEAEEAEEAE